MTRTFQRSIPVAAVAALKRTVGRFNRRARRNGLEPMTLAVGRQVMSRPYGIPAPPPVNTAMIYLDTVQVTLTGEVPVVPGGWEVVAVAKHDRTTGVRTYSYKQPGVDLPDNGESTMCDHCSKNRRRKTMFYLRGDDGKVLRIGRRCVKDFLPTVEAGHLAAIAESRLLWSLLDADELAPDGPMPWQVERTYSVGDVLAVALSVVERSGRYVSRRMAEAGEGVATAQEVTDALDGSLEGLSKRHKRKAAKVLAYLRNLSVDGGTAYDINLQAVASADRVTDRHVGILASGVAVHRRHLAEVERQERLASMPEADTHVGTVGKREELTVCLEQVRVIEGFYGTTHVHTFRTLGGACIVWFCKGAPIDSSAGDTVTIRATVKRHGIYQGEKQTTVNRVALVA